MNSYIREKGDKGDKGDKAENLNSEFSIQIGEREKGKRFNDYKFMIID